MNISPSLTGLIEKIYVEVGDRVRKGDTLVRMDQNQLNTTRIAFANLQIEMNRVQMLLESEAISQQTGEYLRKGAVRRCHLGQDLRGRGTLQRGPAHPPAYQDQ